MANVFGRHDPGMDAGHGCNDFTQIHVAIVAGRCAAARGNMPLSTFRSGELISFDTGTTSTPPPKNSPHAFVYLVWTCHFTHAWYCTPLYIKSIGVCVCLPAVCVGGGGG